VGARGWREGAQLHGLRGGEHTRHPHHHRLRRHAHCPPPPPLSAQAAKQQWLQDAADFLLAPPNDSHWYCQHGRIAQGLLELLLWHDDQPVVQRIWRQAAAMLQQCVDCVTSYHAIQVEPPGAPAGGGGRPAGLARA